MEEHRDAVATHVNVALEDLRALLESGGEAREGIFGVRAGRAAVADHHRSLEFEIGMRHGVTLLYARCRS